MSDNNSPVFPVTNTSLNNGLTKREWFAGMALCGILANPETGSSVISVLQKSRKHADDMLAELEKSK